MRIWDVAHRRTVATLHARHQKVIDAALSPSGDLVASAGPPGVVVRARAGEAARGAPLSSRRTDQRAVLARR